MADRYPKTGDTFSAGGVSYNRYNGKDGATTISRQGTKYERIASQVDSGADEDLRGKLVSGGAEGQARANDFVQSVNAKYK
jgi:hypothetical protein